MKIQDILEGKEKEVDLKCWIWKKREQKTMIFLILRDSSGLIQTTIKKDSPLWETAKKLTVESSIRIKGKVKEDQRAPGGYEIVAEDIEIFQIAERWPITRDVSPEFLMEVRHLYVRVPKMAAVWRIRDTVFKAIREYFRKQGYYEVHFPFLTKTSESGLEMFEVDYFGKKLRLAQTGQFYAEALIFGLEKVFGIGPSFRAEKSHTSRHLMEYWHAEMEAAWMDLDGLAKEAEGLISYVCEKVLKEREKDLKFLGRDIEKLKRVKPPFPRITYDEALKILEKDGLKVKWGKDLRTIEEKQLMKHYDKPLIVTHYPKEVMAFYKPSDEKNPKVARCLDVLLPETGVEVIGGSERDLNIETMKKELIKRGEDPKDYEWYFDLRKYGSVPHSGFGLGVDRLVQWICGLDHIRDALPFPRTMRWYYP